MKKLLAYIVAGCLAVGLAGCSQGLPLASQPTAPLTRDHGSQVTEPVNTVLPMHAVVLPSVKETVSADDGTALFSLSFQQVQVILHNKALEEKIIGDLQERRGPVLADAQLLEDRARQDYPESEFWSEYFTDISYTPTRLDQAVLSLFGNCFSYSGGPHPSLSTDSVTYDLQTGDVMFLDDILTPECTPDTLYQLILQSLSSREEDLYYDYADALGDRFTGELHSIQDWYFSRNGLCFHFAPYDIAPYSSGTVIAELPYSSLTGVLKEKYFPTEAPTATGSMYAQPCSDEDDTRFSFIAEVVLQEDGTEVLLYPDAAVTDLRIESGSRYEDSNQYIAGATIFAASTLNIGDAIRLKADFTGSDSILRLVYRSGNQEYSSFITYDAAGGSFTLTNE